MLLIKRNGNPAASFPGFFNNFITRDSWNKELDNLSSSTNDTIPAVNIRETNENFIVEMAVPGKQKNDFDITLIGNLLTIRADKKTEDAIAEGYTQKEFNYQSFVRLFTLPKEVVDADKMEANYENGILQLIIPKNNGEQRKGARRIAIS